MADYIAYFCGEWMPASRVKIDPTDRGFLVGDAVFDVARTFNGKSFRMRGACGSALPVPEVRSHRPGPVAG